MRVGATALTELLCLLCTWLCTLACNVAALQRPYPRVSRLLDLLKPEKLLKTAGFPAGLAAKAIGLLVKDLHVVLRVAI